MVQVRIERCESLGREHNADRPHRASIPQGRGQTSVRARTVKIPEKAYPLEPGNGINPQNVVAETWCFA